MHAFVLFSRPPPFPPQPCLLSLFLFPVCASASSLNKSKQHSSHQTMKDEMERQRQSKRGKRTAKVGKRQAVARGWGFTSVVHHGVWSTRPQCLHTLRACLKILCTKTRDKNRNAIIKRWGGGRGHKKPTNAGVSSAIPKKHNSPSTHRCALNTLVWGSL